MHFSTKVEKYIRSSWGYETYFLNFYIKSSGVAIFVINIDYKMISFEKDTEGNLLILNCSICDNLVNIYGPKRDTSNFYNYVSKKMSKFEDSIFILAGDFNLVLNPDADSFNYLHLNNPKKEKTPLPKKSRRNFG
jgi:hypothetical protein